MGRVTLLSYGASKITAVVHLQSCTESGRMLLTHAGRRGSSRLLAMLTLTLTLYVHSLPHETHVKRRAKGMGELQSTLRDAWRSQFGKGKILCVVVFGLFSRSFSSFGKFVSYATGLDVSTGPWALFVSSVLCTCLFCFS